MALVPKETITSTLILVGIGLALVATVLIFAFSILKKTDMGSSNGGSGRITPRQLFPTPTPEFVPNSSVLENDQPVD